MDKVNSLEGMKEMANSYFEACGRKKNPIKIKIHKLRPLYQVKLLQLLLNTADLGTHLRVITLMACVQEWEILGRTLNRVIISRGDTHSAVISRGNRQRMYRRLLLAQM